MADKHLGMSCGSQIKTGHKGVDRSIPRREAAQGVPASKRSSKA